MYRNRLTVADIEFIAHRLAQETMGWDEPIPDFSTRYTNSLERCIEQPFLYFGGKQLYPGMIKKAAILFYLMIKNHPFQNSNKRIAMVTLLFFLHKHKKWMRVDYQELYNFAKWVAESNAKLQKETLRAIQAFLREYVRDL